ncbi:glutaminase B [Alteromonas sp. ASW11-130]|uniref:glutaminase B n=1 Tax=Alteromonas sp. ASW11-130 TaxID=3015775 RepID=UPI0022425164|nr:glutaminase B [Alteromonas sp. ASW11-130]MCW8091483.1 glutaminase B [Alteromonas sp. ASW11-130]
MQELLNDILEEVKPLVGKGNVASYIPELAKVNPNQFGIAICDTQGKVTTAGDATTGFSIQSISKVFNLVLAYIYYGNSLWDRVGCEPSGLPFNSLVQLEYENGIPRNPFINAGALVVSDMVHSRLIAPHVALRDLIRKLSDNPSILADIDVADSEFEYRARNAAMSYLMKAFGNFNNDVEEVLRTYFMNCAIKMSCVDLARATQFLANRGFCTVTKKEVLTGDQTRQMNALLATSGLYDEAGSFAFKVGLPGKSGVGGGIIAVVPGRFSICVWSPALNKMGNSMAGVAALESLTRHIKWSVY